MSIVPMIGTQFEKRKMSSWRESKEDCGDNYLFEIHPQLSPL